ncbi:LuxR C-terminal-related transcriptional regulator [cf. Phormidesmis sp. LEGE 11477]|uniref:helix-turn-helix transcriptional regulator n=1 Tax=cf. Phormidesmis sp. LEGE 11477 TaxID=1828680 RepID=UPI00187FA48C|nr:LuxR C-terminal-related transcriptional regulator [cf. Phormidesmis sp. LEGE 11477]MBE9060984.1 GAF domain-containing protein [cf. Phormidesmis sp. LEGE 11477]
MPPDLHSFFSVIATAPTEEVLRYRFMDIASDCFGVQRWGIYLLNEQNKLKSVDAKGVSDTFIERYQQYGASVDPVLRYVRHYHAPAHEAIVLPQGGWKQSELYKRCCSTHNHEHIMTGPIVGKGRLVGTVNFARIGNAPSFGRSDLAALGAVCAHFSARLAEVRSLSATAQNILLQRLTPREVEIVDLVAKGLTNAAIGKELWITQNSVKQALKRMFKKLGVSARTEMVAKLREHI